MVTLTVGILLAFIPFQRMGLTAVIISLSGIAFAIGAVVDASIVEVEKTHKNLEICGRTGRKED